MGITLAQGMKAVAALKEFDVVRRTEAIINDDPETVSDLVKRQLLDGKKKDGSFLASMSTDPYFKKQGAWERYAANKMRKFPSSVRPFDVPNLIFDKPGKYHPGIRVIAMNGKILYPNDSQIAAAVQAKFNPDDTLGLTDENKAKYRTEVLIPQLRQQLRKELT